MLAWLLKLVAKIAAAVPWRWARAWACQWGRFIACVLRPRRRYVLKTLARCLPELSERERRRLYVDMWCHQALNIMEIMRFVGGREQELQSQIEIRGEEHLEEARAQGKGVLVLVAHLGNYILMALTAVRIFRYPLAAIAKQLRNPSMEHLWQEVRRRGGVIAIPARNGYRASVRVLRNNGLLGFMLDQNRPEGKGIFVDFFGQTASTSPGLAFMSAQTGAPVLPAFIHRTPEGRHIVEIQPWIAPPPDRKPESLLEYTAIYTRITEAAIRRHPAQWLWLHKRWKTRPPEEDASATPSAPSGSPV